jgi:hypothetical protein
LRAAQELRVRVLRAALLLTIIVAAAAVLVLLEEMELVAQVELVVLGL